MRTNEKGDIATAKVICDLTCKGYEIYLPISEHGKTDLIALRDNKPVRLQVKYSVNCMASAGTIYGTGNGYVRTKYIESDFDYYALYYPQVDKVIYPSIKFAGATIRCVEPESYGNCYWYEDFLDLTDKAEKRFIKSSKYNEYLDKRATNNPSKSPDKETLEKLVWSKPSVELAIELGVSDRMIGKWCAKFGIDKPPRGYWTKRNKLQML